MQKNEQFIASLSEEGRYRILVDAITDYAVYMLDQDGRISSWNAGAQRFKGYSQEEVLGEHFSLFYTDEDREAGKPQLALATAANEGRFETEGWRVRKDGSTFWTHVIIDPIRDENGKLIGYAKVTRDLTERKEAEREVEKAREALFQTQKMEAIGQLTGGVAHDFNNLLMVILTSLNLLRKRLPNDPKALSLIENATKGAQRGADLTQRMLAFARRQDFVAQPTDLPNLVHEIGSLLRRSLDTSVALELDFPEGLAAVMADKNQLETILLNLVVNARDALPKGGTIMVNAMERSASPQDATELAGGRYVCLAVTDNGEGMDAETLARAEEPFFTTKGVGKGTGLGLSMVQGLLKQWGGRMRIQSTPRVGTTVELWLQVASDNNIAAAEAASEIQPLRDNHVRSATVLVVDDDALVLMGTSAILEDLGHTVFEAHSGDEALDILRQQPDIAVLLTDQAMPSMTGLQLIHAVRHEFPNLPVILATGYAEIEEGATQNIPRLSKPFTESQLERALMGVLG